MAGNSGGTALGGGAARIGVLALQGSVAEHMRALSAIEGITPCEVRDIEEIHSVSGLILPGGESTTMGKLIIDFGLAQHLTGRINDGMPVWGTCAGMILLAKEIVDEAYVHLGVMDISVRRNAYGSQLDSFKETASVPSVSQEDIPLVFIRAPWVEKAGADVEVLAEVNGRIAAVRQRNMLATSFHPELTKSPAFHRYFAGMVKAANLVEAGLR